MHSLRSEPTQILKKSLSPPFAVSPGFYYGTCLNNSGPNKSPHLARPAHSLAAPFNCFFFLFWPLDRDKEAPFSGERFRPFGQRIERPAIAFSRSRRNKIGAGLFILRAMSRPFYLDGEIE